MSEQAGNGSPPAEPDQPGGTARFAPGSQSGQGGKSGQSGPSSRSRPAGQSGQSGQRKSGQSGKPGQSGQTGRSGQADKSCRRQPSRPDSDLIGDLQRWLIRSGARSVRQDVGDQFRRMLSGGRGERGGSKDIWDVATTEPPPGDPGEAPECAWCPVCRAARRIRESGPGFGSQLSGAGEAVAAAVQEALNLFDGVLSRPGPAPGSQPSRPESGSAEPGAADGSADHG